MVTAVVGKSHRSHECNSCRSPGYAQATFRNILSRSRQLRVSSALSSVPLTPRRSWPRGLDGVVAGRGCAVWHSHYHCQPGLLPYGASHGGVNELRRATHRGLRRAQSAANAMVESAERSAVRRSRQACSGTPNNLEPGRAAAPIYCRRRCHWPPQSRWSRCFSSRSTLIATCQPLSHMIPA